MRNAPAALLLAGLLAAFPKAPAAAALPEAPPPGAPSPAEAATSRIRLEFDDRVPVDFLRLVEGRIIDDDSLDAWVDLPGNSEILRIGALRGSLDRGKLRDNLWHAILGHTARQGQGLGSLAFGPLEDLRKMLAELSGREEEIRRRVAGQLGVYLPTEVPEVRSVVRLHLGGTWDGRTRDDIFLNLSFLHNYAPPWFGAAEGILAHEATHIAHRQLDVLPEDAVTPVGLFAVGLSQIHSEGIARQIETGLLEGSYSRGTYAALAARRHHDGLAEFAGTFARLEEMREICLRRMDQPACRNLIRSGLWRGGATYVLGQGMARAIEGALGRKTLGSTLSAGAIRFFELYAQATRMLPGLPALGEGFDRDLAAAAAFLAERREAWRLSRDAHAAHGRGDYETSAAVFQKIAGRDSSDPIAAYNVACALARTGDLGRAMEWLDRAVTLGYSDRAHMEADPDLVPLRNTGRYRRLVDRLSSPPADPNRSMK